MSKINWWILIITLIGIIALISFGIVVGFAHYQVCDRMTEGATILAIGTEIFCFTAAIRLIVWAPWIVERW